MVERSVPGPVPLSERSSREYELLIELEFEVFALRNLIWMSVSVVAEEVVKDWASHVDPDAVLQAPSFIWVKRLTLTASARRPGALSPTRATRVATASTRIAANGRIRMPYSLNFSAVIDQLPCRHSDRRSKSRSVAEQDSMFDVCAEIDQFESTG